MLTEEIYENLSYELLLKEASSLKKRKVEVENSLTDLKLRNVGKTRWEQKDWNLKTRYGGELMRINYALSKVSLLIKKKRAKAEKRMAESEVDVRNSNHLLRWTLRIIRENIKVEELEDDDKLIFNAAQEKLMNYFGASKYL